MIRVVIAFLIGIVAAFAFPNTVSLYTGLLLLTGGCIGYGILFLIQRKSPWGQVAGILGLSVVATAGFVQTLISTDANHAHHLTNYTGTIKYYVATVTSSGERKKNAWRYEARVQRVNDGQKWTRAEGKILLYVTVDSGQNSPLSYGEERLIKGRPKIVSAPQNPHAFNFKRFLRLKNIHHQHRVTPGQIVLISSNQHRDIKYYAYAARDWAMRQLQEYVPDSRAQAIALALTLGISDSIDNTLRQAYAASGAMHVLAVSGLHVGIIYGIIILMLAPLRSFAWGHRVIAITSVIVLWGYAFLTGLSPSVLRAVTMFSFIALSRLLGRSANIYNTLAGSAFLLLLFNPYLIASVGFQLSYLAVFGIVALYRPLYLLWEPRFAFLDWMWSVTCISIAAQLATFALGLLYFHQFPVYFLLANFFVLPGAMVELIGSILLILISFLPPLATFLGMGLQWFISRLNEVIFTIESLPFSVIKNIYITPAQCFLLMMMVLSFVLLLKHKKYHYLITTLVCVVFFVFSRWLYLYDEILQKRLVVYAVPGHTGVEWVENGTSYFYGDASLVKDNNRIRFHILPNRLFCGVSDTDVSHYTINDRQPIKVFCRNGITVAIVNQSILSWPDDLRVDYLIVGNRAFRSFDEIKKIFQFDKLILSSSNPRGYCKQILKESEGRFVYSVPHQGAYTKKL